jgi:hypothetical protein
MASRTCGATRNFLRATVPGLTVTPGYVIFDDNAPTIQEDTDESGYFDEPYHLCSCGSGLKWRFCCRTVPDSSI